MERESQARAPRRKLFEPAVLRVRGKEHRCHLLNLSRTGAAFHCDVALKHDTSIVITCRGHDMVLRARRSEGKHHGAQFVLPLCDETLKKFDCY